MPTLYLQVQVIILKVNSQPLLKTVQRISILCRVKVKRVYVI